MQNAEKAKFCWMEEDNVEWMVLFLIFLVLLGYWWFHGAVAASVVTQTTAERENTTKRWNPYHCVPTLRLNRISRSVRETHTTVTNENIHLIMGDGVILIGGYKMSKGNQVAWLGIQLLLPNKDCSWANRCEKFVNNFLLGENCSCCANGSWIRMPLRKWMKGSNTQTGTLVLKYVLFPLEEV